MKPADIETKAPASGLFDDAPITVDTATGRRSQYSYDASNYRVQPAGVAFPRSVDEVSALMGWCHERRIAVTVRGGGTSMAGNAVGDGLIIDFSRYLGCVVSIDPDAKTAVVEPGVVLGDLAAMVETETVNRLTFAPDPSSKTRATIGGSIANDACGNHSVRHGRMADHVLSLDLVLADGLRVTATRSGLVATDPSDGSAVARAESIEASLRSLTAKYLAEFRLELGRIPRQVSGFHLSHLLPENGFDVARALVGSEGTCAVVVGATVRLVDVSPSALLLILGYDDVVDAARDIVTILEFSPAAVEGIDEQIVATMRARRGPDSVTDLPRGRAWLYVDLDGDDAESVAEQAELLFAKLRTHGRVLEGREVSDPVARKKLWRIREDGAGLSSRLELADGSSATSWPGWEDSAVAPENLADYLADFRELLAEFRLIGVMYGHFGAGCMHIRITFDQRTEDGRRTMSEFLTAAAHLVVRHGGTLSGEHGDGRARSALLSTMYSPAMMDAFASFKNIFDPTCSLNPGIIIDGRSVTDDLAQAGIPQRQWTTSFALHEVGGRDPRNAFGEAVQRCIGVGRCRSDSGGVMCPSYRATGDEKDSTRGRARVLQEMVRGAETAEAGWQSEDVREALDLCLSCKACSTDCPTGVDMATYKAEFFDHYYAGKVRPLSHYSLGWLPRWLKLTGRTAPVVNTLLRSPFKNLVLRMGGVTTERDLPPFASRRAVKKALASSNAVVGIPNTVLVVDSFTKGFRPNVGAAARRVIENSDGNAEVRTDVCCGLTWITTGQLATARKMLSRTAELLDDGSNRPIVVIEPSCASALRKDLPELVDTEAARRVSARVRSFAEHVGKKVESGWRPPRAVPSNVTVQTHCHEYAVFGSETQRRALHALGVTTVREATGCCGVAGNFGFEREHFDTSMKVAEQALVPALQASADAVILADGFSCHMQIRQLADVSATPQDSSLHLAELLDPGVPDET